MMTSGFFRLLPDIPKIFWRYPISYMSYGAWAIQVLILLYLQEPFNTIIEGFLPSKYYESHYAHCHLVLILKLMKALDQSP